MSVSQTPRGEIRTYVDTFSPETTCMSGFFYRFLANSWVKKKILDFRDKILEFRRQNLKVYGETFNFFFKLQKKTSGFSSLGLEFA